MQLRHLRHFAQVAIAAIILSLGNLAQAQDTTSAIRGKLLDSNGNPLANARVEVTDTRTGATRRLESNQVGTFYATNLPVGGPYRVTVNNVKTVTIDSISLGDIYNLSMNLDPSQALSETDRSSSYADMEEIVVFGDAKQLLDVAAGPAVAYGAHELNTSVAYDRDIKDVYTLDPRMNLDGDSQVNCIGKHPRFNSINLDGVSQNDRFGLNSNGYSTATGMPFPYDGIAQVAVELAPFDVTYGGFTACNVNAVTKSGSNEWSGSVFYEQTEDDWRGDSLTVDEQRQEYKTVDYTEEKYGLSLGGPLLADRLFIFAAYEQTEEPEFIGMGYAGSGNGVERPWLSQADYNRINTIARDTYNYNTGGQPDDGSQEEEKYMARLDWNISDDHNLALIYNFYDGFEHRASDGDSDEFEFANHFYTKGAESETYTLRFTSQWSHAFTTEFFFSDNSIKDSQVTRGPKDFADMQIEIDGNTIYLGADDSRQANGLNTDSTFFKAVGEVLLGDHLLTFGYEQETLEIFNLFVQHSRGGEYDFEDDSNLASNPARCAAFMDMPMNSAAQQRFADPGCHLSGLDKFELGRPDSIDYGSGGGTNNANDAASSFENVLHTLYVQDEWYIPQRNLTLTFGLRYDRFTSDDRPKFNQTFATANNGLRNDTNLDDLDLLMPRLGITWEATDKLTLRGGLGLYSGGNPNVWISNAWGNDGITNVQVDLDNPGNTRSVINDLPLTGSARPGYDIPQSLFNEVRDVTAADASDSRLVLIDPDYEQPGEWKLALGGTYLFNWGTSMDADIIYSKQQDAAYYVDVSQTTQRSTMAGQPIYDYTTGRDNFMLTNASSDGESIAASLVFSDTHDWGLDWTLGYAFVDAEDVSPMTSSVASSNFNNLALVDIRNPEAATSNYVSPHRITARFSYGQEFFSGLETRFTLMMYRSKGQPQSHVMNSAALEGNGRNRRHLLYVPTGPNDPNVVYETTFDQAAFNAFVQREGYDPGFVPRNENHVRWSSRMDLRIDQELPAFVDGAKGRIFLKVYNLLNLIDDDMGLQYDAQSSVQQVVTADVDAMGRYVYKTFQDRSLSDLLENRSLWELRLGIQFEF